MRGEGPHGEGKHGGRGSASLMVWVGKGRGAAARMPADQQRPACLPTRAAGRCCLPPALLPLLPKHAAALRLQV